MTSPHKASSSTHGIGIHINSVSKSYLRSTVLQSLSLTIEAGAFISLLGPSGCGKTTLLRLISGLENPDDGKITLGDRLVFGSNPWVCIPPEKREMGMVFQQYAVWPHLNVLENVLFPLTVGDRKRKFSKEAAWMKARNALARVRLENREKHYPHQLSGGQQQRVALARALVMEPQVLLLDEPLSNLDTELRSDLRKEIKQLHGELGMTVIHVTHDPEEARELATRIIRLKNGQIDSDLRNQ